MLANRQQSAWCDWFEIDFDRPGRDGFSYANFEGHDQLVKLNHANPQVLEWAVDVGKFWLERGVDAFRLDAAYALPPGFLAEFADRACAVRADVSLVGEVIHGDYVRTARASHLTTVTQYELWKAIWSSLNDGNFFELAHCPGTSRRLLSALFAMDVCRQPRHHAYRHAAYGQATFAARHGRLILHSRNSRRLRR